MIVQQFAGIGRWLLSQCVKLHTLVWLVTAAAVWGEEGGGGQRLTEKRDGGRVRVSSHSLQYVITGLLHYSTMLFLSSPPLPPSLLRSVSVLAVISSRSCCLTALCPATAHLSLPSAPRSPQWGWHPRIWWTSEALIPAGGFRGKPHMNGLTGRGGAASKELG